MRLLLIALSFFAATASANEKPPVPYYDWGGCPFEGCTYQQWTTKQEVVARAEPSLTAKTLFKVPRGQNVEGLTGVVIVEKPGIVKVCNDPAVPAQLSGFGIGLRRCFHL
ncbi:hypothetical protein [Aeromonas veronii]|uniref:hypothetical protein n=1 Tax=Aeromonas veronii TaxID=654 RepID=UPI003004B0B2